MAEQRERIIAALEERGITLEHLALVMEQGDADPFDLLCHLAFHAPIHSRRERADRLKRERREFFARYSADARAILEGLLEQYAEYGPRDLVLPDVLHLPRFVGRTIPEISALFGGAEHLRSAVTELQALLYAA